MIGVIATRRGSETCRHLADRRGRWDRIRRIGPIHSRQVMQRDTCAPAVGGRPDKKRQQHNHHRQAQHRMRTDHSEIDQDDNRANGQSIADDGEGPRITGITCEDQTAVGTAFKLRPPGKQWPSVAVRTALAQPTPKRRADQFRAGRRHLPPIADGRTNWPRRLGDAGSVVMAVLWMHAPHLHVSVSGKTRAHVDRENSPNPVTVIVRLRKLRPRKLSILRIPRTT
jgi:hypothetical protein